MPTAAETREPSTSAVPGRMALGTQLRSLGPPLKRWFIDDGYYLDWLGAAAAILIGLLVPTYAVEPIDRYETPGDPTLSYPYQDSTISSTVLYILTFVWPAAVVTLVAWLQRSWADW